MKVVMICLVVGVPTILVLAALIRSSQISRQEEGDDR